MSTLGWSIVGKDRADGRSSIAMSDHGVHRSIVRFVAPSGTAWGGEHRSPGSRAGSANDVVACSLPSIAAAERSARCARPIKKPRSVALSRFLFYARNTVDENRIWCRRRDSNSHSFRHYPLKIACLPISPRRHFGTARGAILASHCAFVKGVCRDCAGGVRDPGKIRRSARPNIASVPASSRDDHPRTTSIRPVVRRPRTQARVRADRIPARDLRPRGHARSARSVRQCVVHAAG